MLCRNLDILEAIHIFYDLSTTEIVDSCCDRIGISSTNNNGHGYLGTYKKEDRVTVGRAQYVKTGGKGLNYIGNATLYWHAGINVWIVSIRNTNLIVSIGERERTPLLLLKCYYVLGGTESWIDDCIHLSSVLHWKRRGLSECM